METQTGSLIILILFSVIFGVVSIYGWIYKYKNRNNER